MSAIYWGHADLEKLREEAGRGYTLKALAIRQGSGATKALCDQALWVLMGRSIEEACDILNERAAA